MKPPTYDSGVLVAADKGNHRIWQEQRRLARLGVSPYVPAVVLAQAWRGGPQVGLRRLVKSCRILPFTTELAWEAGRVCGLAGTSDVVDAAVVLTAQAAGGAVVTSDPRGIAHLADALGLKLVIEPV